MYQIVSTATGEGVGAEYYTDRREATQAAIYASSHEHVPVTLLVLNDDGEEEEQEYY